MECWQGMGHAEDQPKKAPSRPILLLTGTLPEVAFIMIKRIQKETNDPGPGQTVSARRTGRNAGNMTDGGVNATLWPNIHQDRLANKR